MTALLPRFEETRYRAYIPTGAKGRFDFDGHAVPLEWHDDNAGLDLGETFFAKCEADVEYEDGWHVTRLFVNGSDISKIPELKWMVESCDRYVHENQHLVDHDYE